MSSVVVAITTFKNFAHAYILKPSLLSRGAYLVLLSSIHVMIKTYILCCVLWLLTSPAI